MFSSLEFFFIFLLEKTDILVNLSYTSGPGQLVVYPILDLRGYKRDIHWYMRALEESIILALQYTGISDVSFMNQV